MARTSIVFGMLLIALGLVGFFLLEPDPAKRSFTALIPSFVGGPLVLLGLIALKDALRKHAMHLASMIGLLGFVGAGYQFVKNMTAGKSVSDNGPMAQLAMTVLCGVFLALCIRSFVNARRSRAVQANP